MKVERQDRSWTGAGRRVKEKLGASMQSVPGVREGARKGTSGRAGQGANNEDANILVTY